MDQVRQSLRSLEKAADERLTGQDGQGLVEYGLILLLVAIGTAGALGGFGVGLSSRYAAIAASIPNF
jgi:Flp pilus assembly pilin Flp